MTAGRPTDYTPELLEKAREYLALDHETIPSIAGLALYLGIRRETCHVWAKEDGKEEFSNILEELLAKQENKLVSNGLKGSYNSTITKLILTKHGYTDKQDVTSGGKQLPAPILGNVLSHDSNEEDSETKKED
jgi:hypothetical protein